MIYTILGTYPMYGITTVYLASYFYIPEVIILKRLHDDNKLLISDTNLWILIACVWEQSTEKDIQSDTGSDDQSIEYCILTNFTDGTFNLMLQEK